MKVLILSTKKQNWWAKCLGEESDKNELVWFKSLPLKVSEFFGIWATFSKS